jgi:hypothetical protein
MLTCMTQPAGKVKTSDQALGRAIHQAMWDRRVKQTELAPQVGLDQSTLSKKLRGERPWYFAEVISVADALRMNVLDLIGTMWGPDEGPKTVPVASGEVNQVTERYMRSSLHLIVGEGSDTKPIDGFALESA